MKEEEIKDLAIKKHGSDPFKYGGQRDGFIEGFKQSEKHHQQKTKEVIERYSNENLMKLQIHFVSLYGSDEMAQEKANSFAVGFGKACELIIKDLTKLKEDLNE